MRLRSVDPSVGRSVGGPHTTGVGRGSRSEENNFIISPTALYALSLSPSLSPGGIILRSLFPHDAGETKDYVHTKSSFSLSLCLCGTDRSLLCLRISCERVEYVAAALSQSQVFPSLIPPAARPRPRPSPAVSQPAPLPAAPSITFSPPRLKRLSAFRLLIRLHSRLERAEPETGGEAIVPEAICFSSSR